MSPTNYITCRVRGIPAGTTREGLEVLVAQAVSCQDASGVRVRSLAVDASRPREMVATVTFANVPEELSDSRGDWTIEAPQDINLVIDMHFHGCTTLYCPPVDEWRYDLIAISGLNGHAFGSFKKKNSSYMWLRDSLPQDFPGCRVIIYGYDTRLQGSRSYQSLLDIGKKFQTAVRQVRQDARKPLILLGHSLGGIVVKEAISSMRGSSIDADKLTFAAIKGVIFFGVPNQGMDIRSLIPMVGDQANRGFLHTLDHNSPVLRIQAKEFSTAISGLRCEILNFYETQESPTAQQNEDGTWSMSGPPAVLVDTHSATHGRPDDSQGHRVYPIDCDHSNLIKFSSAHDEPYAAATAFLQEIDSHEASPIVAMTTTQEACYQSLGFREQYYRMDSLEPSPGTCNWLTTHELFTEWLESSKGFLWIRGKPGSGKSMAMKHALKHVKASTRGIVASFFIHAQGAELQRSILGIYRSLLHQIYPYSPESFSGLTMRFQEYEKEAGPGKEDIKWSWMQGEIRQNLFQGLPKLCKKERVIILVDALDEAGEEQARVIFEDLETLVDSLGDDSARHLSLCVACRHYPDISFNTGKKIVMESLNSSDIEYVVNWRLSSDDVFGGLEKQLLKTEILRKSEGIFQWTTLVIETVIRMRQEGDSFKAAMKNVDRVPRGLHLLYKALLEPKDEEEDEFKQRTSLFQWVALAAKPLAPRELQHALALHSKMTYKFVCEYEESDAFISEHDFERKIKRLSKGLMQINGQFESGRIEFIHQSIPDFLLGHGGLALLSGLPGSDLRALGHLELSMTCLKFLFIEEIRHSLSKLAQRNDVCLRGRRVAQFPLISYAWRNWIFHAVSGKELNSGGNDEFCSAQLMEIFCWPHDQAIIAPWVKLRRTLGDPLDSWARQFRRSLLVGSGTRVLNAEPHVHIPQWPCENARLIHLLAATGLLGENAQKTMSSDLEHRAKSDHYPCVCTPLAYALVWQQKKVVQNMIAAGVRVQYKTEPSQRSPLYLASRWGDPAVVSLLLKFGSKVSHRESTSWTPLHVAALTGNVTVIRILVGAGAKVDCQFLPSRFHRQWPHVDDNGQAALHIAAINGKVEAVSQLIDYGADLNLKSLERKAPPLFSAILGGNIDTTRLLLELGADIHARDLRGDSAIHYALYASKRGDRVQCAPAKLIVELLIQFGCDVNARNDLGTTPLHMFADEPSTEIMSLLLSHGANPNSRTRYGETPIHRAVIRSPEATKALLRTGADIHTEARAKDYIPGGFPIHLAAFYPHPTIVQLLLEAGSNVNAANRKGETPLRLALGPHSLLSRKEADEVVKLLLRAELDLKTVRDGIRTAYFLDEVLEILLGAGINPNTRDDEGETAIFWVVKSRALLRREHEGIKMAGVELLLKSGADPSITNRTGRTALSYAIRNGDNRVAGLLRESGSHKGVWHRHSVSSFARKRVDELAGRSSRFFKRDRYWYPNTARNVVDQFEVVCDDICILLYPLKWNLLYSVIFPIHDRLHPFICS